MKLNSFIIIEYIKSSINILVDTKVKCQIESFFSNFNSTNPFEDNNDFDHKNYKKAQKDTRIKHSLNNEEYNTNTSTCQNINEYEDLLRKLESDIRNHIKIQHQYRIYSDNLKSKIEELEKSKNEYKKSVIALQEVN